MNNKNRLLIVLSVLTIIMTIIGGTLAYWRWQSNTTEKTNITFNIGNNFSCSADGGGDINNNSGTLAPAACTNSTYAIKRTVNVNVNVTEPGKKVYLDMWLKVNSIGTNLSMTENFKYALTTSPNSCTTGMVAYGNFIGTRGNPYLQLTNNKEYTTTTTETYYLWIWLDAAETYNGTQNENFSLSLGGTCTDEETYYVYTSGTYSDATINVGQLIPSNVIQYSTPEAAMDAASQSASTEIPFYLRHKVKNSSEVTQTFCLVSVGTIYGEYNSCTDDNISYHNETACNQNIINSLEEDNIPYTNENGVYTYEYENETITDSCVLQDETVTEGNLVIETDLGFVITPTMTTNCTGSTAGTYYLKGGDIIYPDINEATSIYYGTNQTVLQTAFGLSNCRNISSVEYECSCPFGSQVLSARIDTIGENEISLYGPHCKANEFDTYSFKTFISSCINHG